MFNKVLAAVDGSGHASKAIKLACELALKHDGELVLITVYNQDYFPPEVMGAATADAIARELQAERDFAEKIVAGAAEDAKIAGIDKVSTLVRKGDAAAQILEAAETEGADTIVLGSHGHGTLKGLLIGSVSTKVAAHAKCTCITVR
jgi:nucleotide-binding universal stress UspA family protein